MHIKEVKPSQRKKGRFLVVLEDETILRVTEEELLRFGLRAGEALEGETLEALRKSARTSQVKARGTFHTLTNSKFCTCAPARKAISMPSPVAMF